MTAKSRQTEARRALIIESSTRLSWPRRLALGAMTGLLWALWLYLWSPLLTLVLWAGSAWVGWSIARPRLVDGSIMPTLAKLLVIALVLGIVLLSWAFVEYLRFRNVERRRWTSVVTAEELAHSELTHPGLTAERILLWQASRRLRVHHDAAGHVEDADVLAEPGSRL